MRRPMSLTLVTLSSIFYFLLVPARDCFFPDGTILPGDKSNYAPCGPDDGPHSACCGKGDGCSSNGLCYGNAGFMYRGGCTDAKWAAPECALHCQTGKRMNKPAYRTELLLPSRFSAKGNKLRFTVSAIYTLAQPTREALLRPSAVEQQKVALQATKDVAILPRSIQRHPGDLAASRREQV